MANFLNSSPHLVLSSFPDLARNPNHLLFRSPSPRGLFLSQKPCLRGGAAVARVGFQPGLFPDPEELLGRVEGILYTVADAAVSTTDSVVDTKQSSDWFSGITGSMESVLKVLKDGLSTLHVPYSYGFAIILLTVIVKAATFPFTKKQVESAMAMRSLQPQIQAIQQRYAGDQERIQLETARLYKLAAINPLAGCLPTLLTIPVWIGLYRALSNVANEGLLTEGFFWIPSLAGPTTIAARQSGSGISWLFPFVDGHPPLGWSDTFAYLVLPVLLIVSQYVSVQIMQSSQGNDPNLKNSQAITKFLPLLIGYFALSVPSGLSLYWFTNNMLSTAQQVWLQKLGGAKNPARDLSAIISKDDQPQIQKSVLEKSSAKVGAGKGEKLTPEGPRPGERFKQIKEREERKRRQMEEKRKTEHTASNSAQIKDEGQREESKFVDLENEGVADLVDSKRERAVEPVATSPKSSNGVVNGELPKQSSKEDQETASFPGTKNGTVRANAEVDDVQHSHENIGQDAAIEKYTTVTATDRKLSGEGAPRAKREVRAEKEE